MAIERDQPQRVAIHSLAAFRILFGTVMAVAMLRFLANGWVDELFLKPKFHFPYPGLEWIRPWPGFWMHAHVVIVAVCAAGIAAGFCYRVCAILFFAGFTWLELIDRTTYLNHYYLVSLVAGILACLPAHRLWSVDVLLRPSLRRETIPAWMIHLLRFQFGLVYVFAGIAKLNPDWLLKAQPLRLWLAARSDLPWVGPWLEQPWVAFAAAWTGALYDLGVPFLLLHRRTRPFAFAAVMVFHLATGVLFPSIGMFPWIMVAGSTLFFPPGWPSGDWRGTVPFALPRPFSGRALFALYALWQIAVPLRGLFTTGSSTWTGEGFNWAWKVMIVEKTGTASFFARDPASGRRWRVDVREELTPRQATLMAQDPHLIQQFARHLAAQLRGRGQGDVEIQVEAFASLNGRPSQPVFDPLMNLAGPLPPGWILPLRPDPAF
jgi:hypothetical protein